MIRNCMVKRQPSICIIVWKCTKLHFKSCYPNGFFPHSLSTSIHIDECHCSWALHTVVCVYRKVNCLLVKLCVLLMETFSLPWRLCSQVQQEMSTLTANQTTTWYSQSWPWSSVSSSVASLLSSTASRWVVLTIKGVPQLLRGDMCIRFPIIF